ncbi:MAG: MBL fold metallo-hydrolase [Acidobacteria bacterium]|nr:MBL fold metallo-hydrolase [Acidobacteriota bacterium]
MRITPWLYMVGSRQFGLSSRYDCHVYAMKRDAGILLIDAGSGMGHGRIVQNLRDEFGDLSRGTILVTHKHPDHACGAARLHEELGWPIVTSSHTAPLLISGDEDDCGLAEAQRLGSYPPEMRMDAVPVARAFADGDVLALEGFDLTAIHVRGHSADSFVFWMPGFQCLVSADVVFYGGVIGLINTADSSMNGFRTGLAKLEGLDVECLLPGHGMFTLEGGGFHIRKALEEVRKGLIPRCVGQGDLIF